MQDQYPHAKLKFIPHPDQHQIGDLMIANQRGVLQLATNFGKTFQIGWFWWRLGRPSLLVAVPTVALVNQTAEDLADMFGLELSEIGQVGGAHARWKPLTVGTYDSLCDAAQRGYLQHFSALIVDECHSKIGRYVHTIAEHCPAFYRFGMSGTAYKDNDVFHEFNLTALFGPCLADISNYYLVQQGRSDYPLIRLIDNSLDEAPYELTMGWQEEYALLTKDKARNDIIAKITTQALDLNLSTMIFVEHVQHMNNLAHALRDLPAVHLVKGAQNKQNDSVRHLMKTGEARVVVCTSAWRMGVSIPGVNVLIQGSSMKANHNRAQEFGRVLRRSELGHSFYIEFADKGLPRTRKWSQIRMNGIRRQGFPIQTISLDNLDKIFNTDDLPMHYAQPIQPTS